MYYDWIILGALSGGFLSGVDKAGNIIFLENSTHEPLFFEIPIRGMYHASRIAFYTGVGSVAGGITAATAPISIPAYIWWMNRHNK
jgi:hypothetical protein